MSAVQLTVIESRTRRVRFAKPTVLTSAHLADFNAGAPVLGAVDEPVTRPTPALDEAGAHKLEAMARVLRLSLITFGGVVQTKLGEQAAEALLAALAQQPAAEVEVEAGTIERAFRAGWGEAYDWLEDSGITESWEAENKAWERHFAAIRSQIGAKS